MRTLLTDKKTDVSAAQVEAFDPDLVIFDCDGVLIDSEILSARTLIKLLAEHDVEIDDAYVRGAFLGRSFPTVIGIVKDHFGVTLPSDFETDYRHQLLERFETELRPMEGVVEVLSSLQRPFCLATSSSPPRVTRSLHLTGLYPYFSDAIFTASQVRNGKPAPDLFLYAAAQRGVEKSRCLVIEDSLVGLTAGRAAGMPVVWFSGGSHLRQGYADGTDPVLGDFEPDYHITKLEDLRTCVPAVCAPPAGGTNGL